MSRTVRTPQARASEALAVAERRVKRLQTEAAKHKADLARATADLEQAVVRRDYCAASPDLQQQPTPPDTPPTTQPDSEPMEDPMTG